MNEIKDKIKKKILGHNAQQYCYRYNLINKLLNKTPLHLQLIEAESPDATPLIQVHDSSNSFIIARPERVHLYRQGITHRMNYLSDQYLISELQFSANDLVIDCGANTGELTSMLQKKYDVNAICVEPEVSEMRALKKNTKEGRTNAYNLLLWKENCEIDFYSANETGDSSIFAPENTTQKTRKKAVTLDELLRNDSFFIKNQHIVLLKLESEGAEPEILEGATETLKYIKYITADCGPERGYKQENTLIQVLDILTKNNFRPIKFNHERTIILFENMNLS